MATGTATVNFGAAPGAIDASVDVTGQAGFVAASLVEAFILPIATADHNVDEHLLERITVRAKFKANGEFTIRASTDEYPPPLREAEHVKGQRATAEKMRLYGIYTVGWAWV